MEFEGTDICELSCADGEVRYYRRRPVEDERQHCKQTSSAEGIARLRHRGYAVAAAINRWDALDVLRGLTIILMNLMPGSWEFNYSPLEHAHWEVGTLMDMVVPSFLFCIGCAMPLSLQRRNAQGDSPQTLLAHVGWRGARTATDSRVDRRGQHRWRSVLRI
jgi:hypothetical protein